MNADETRQWYKLPVPLAWLCQLDEQPAPNALTDAFGDRYLYAFNPIFRQVRDATVRLGYRFSSEDTPLWRDYQALPLTTLHRILARKTIPYFDTSATVQRLRDENPKAALSPGFLISMLKANHAFHESAHCVAHAVMKGLHCELAALAPAEKDRFVLEAIFAESFANAVERLASTTGGRAISDAAFYALNSYMSRSAPAESVLETAAAAMGASLRFFVLLLASFEANLTAEAPMEETYQRIAKATGCPAESLPALKQLVDTGFKLSAGFRENTNPMYFDLLGYRSEYAALVEARWLDNPAHAKFARRLAAELSQLTGGNA